MSRNDGSSIPLKPHQRQGIEFLWDVVERSAAEAAHHPISGLTVIRNRFNGERIGIDEVHWRHKPRPEWEISGAILAHSMGLGKTRTILTFLCQFQERVRKLGAKVAAQMVKNASVPPLRVIVVCPKTTMMHWTAEISKWAPALSPNSLIGANDSIDAQSDVVRSWYDEGGVLLVTYEEALKLLKVGPAMVIHNDTKPKTVHGAISTADVVVFDEGHRLKNPSTQLVRNIKNLVTRIPIRFGLTGTPLQNHLMEYATLLSIVRPGLLIPSTFRKEFCNVIEAGQMSDSTPEQVGAMHAAVTRLQDMLQPYVHRRGIELLEKELPPRTEVVLFLQLSTEQEVMYRRLIQQLVRIATNGVTDHVSGLPQGLSEHLLKRFSSVLAFRHLASTICVSAQLFSQLHGSEEQIAQELENASSDDFSSSSSDDDDVEEENGENDEKELQEGKPVLSEPELSSSMSSSSSSSGTDSSSETLSSSSHSDHSKKKKKNRSKSGRIAKSARRSQIKQSSSCGSRQSGISQRMTPMEKRAVKEEGKEEEDSTSSLRLLSDAISQFVGESPKIAVCLEIIQKAICKNEKVVVFSLYIKTLRYLREVIESCAWNKERLRCGFLSGADSLKSRGNTIDQFCQSETPRVLLSSTKAGGVGIALHAANHCVLMDHSWNPADDLQATFRVYRYGQTRPVFVYRLISYGTAEHVVFHEALKKAWLGRRVLDGTNPIRQQRVMAYQYFEYPSVVVRDESMSNEMRKRIVEQLGLVKQQQNQIATVGGASWGLPWEVLTALLAKSVPHLQASLVLQRSLVHAVEHSFLLRDNMKEVIEEIMADVVRKAKEAQLQRLLVSSAPSGEGKVKNYRPLNIGDKRHRDDDDDSSCDVEEGEINLPPGAEASESGFRQFLGGKVEERFYSQVVRPLRQHTEEKGGTTVEKEEEASNFTHFFASAAFSLLLFQFGVVLFVSAIERNDFGLKEEWWLLLLGKLRELQCSITGGTSMFSATKSLLVRTLLEKPFAFFDTMKDKNVVMLAAEFRHRRAFPVQMVLDGVEQLILLAEEGRRRQWCEHAIAQIVAVGCRAPPQKRVEQLITCSVQELQRIEKTVLGTFPEFFQIPVLPRPGYLPASEPTPTKPLQSSAAVRVGDVLVRPIEVTLVAKLLGLKRAPQHQPAMVGASSEGEEAQRFSAYLCSRCNRKTIDVRTLRCDFCRLDLAAAVVRNPKFRPIAAIRQVQHAATLTVRMVSMIEGCAPSPGDDGYPYPELGPVNGSSFPALVSIASCASMDSNNFFFEQVVMPGLEALFLGSGPLKYCCPSMFGLSHTARSVLSETVKICRELILLTFISEGNNDRQTFAELLVRKGAECFVSELSNELLVSVLMEVGLLSHTGEGSSSIVQGSKDLVLALQNNGHRVWGEALSAGVKAAVVEEFRWSGMALASSKHEMPELLMWHAAISSANFCRESEAVGPALVEVTERFNSRMESPPPPTAAAIAPVSFFQPAATMNSQQQKICRVQVVRVVQPRGSGGGLLPPPPPPPPSDDVVAGALLASLCVILACWELPAAWAKQQERLLLRRRRQPAYAAAQGHHVQGEADEERLEVGALRGLRETWLGHFAEVFKEALAAASPSSEQRGGAAVDRVMAMLLQRPSSLTSGL